MKVTIKGNYEAEKRRIYNEALKAKQDEYDKIKLISFDLSTIVIHGVMLLLFIFSFTPSVYQNENGVILRYGSLGLLIVAVTLNIWLYKSNKKYYANLIQKHKNMTMDRYIEYIQNNGYNIQFDDKWMITDYDDLKNDFKKVTSLCDPDIVSIEYALADDCSDEISFFVTKKNNQKEIINLEYINVVYRDSEEDELVWDEDRVICLYTNDRDFVKRMKE